MKLYTFFLEKEIIIFDRISKLAQEFTDILVLDPGPDISTA